MMTSTRATVLIPTHNHGPTLRYSVHSALAQSVGDLELLIVGDGVPDETRAIAAELQRADKRVRFFDFPKSPRTGEAYRHQLLVQATGRIVCYLSDDDLWAPHHVETMESLLTDADFVYALAGMVEHDGTLRAGNTVDFRIDGIRELVLSEDLRLGGVPLSCMAHTMEMYRRMPHGWRSTPPGMATNVYMTQQFIGDPSCRWVNAAVPTVLRFPSQARHAWTIDQRVAELAEWSSRIDSPDWLAAFPVAMLDALARVSAEQWLKIKNFKRKINALR